MNALRSPSSRLARFVLRHLTMRPLVLVLLIVAGAPAVVAAESPLGSARHHVWSAFAQGDAAELKPILDSDGKTYVSLPGLSDEQGYFGASQVYYVFRDIYARVVCDDAKIESAGKKDDVAYFRITWSYTRKDSGEKGQAVLLITLEGGSGSYVLTDVRSARP